MRELRDLSGSVWRCPVCAITLNRQTKTSHEDTARHKARATEVFCYLAPSYLESDYNFSIFLTGLQYRSFQGDELKLYRAARWKAKEQHE